MQSNKRHKHIVNQIFNNFNLCVKISNFIVIKNYEIGLSRKKTVQNLIINNYKLSAVKYYLSHSKN